MPQNRLENWFRSQPREQNGVIIEVAHVDDCFPIKDFKDKYGDVLL